MADFVYRNPQNDNIRTQRIVADSNPVNDNYWTRPDFAYDSKPLQEVHRDHVCRPVAVDAYGRPIPGVVVLPADQHVTETEYVTESVYSSKTHPNHNRRDPLDCDNGKCKPLFSPTREQVLLPNKASSGPRTGRFPAGMFQRRAAPGDAGRNWQFGREEAPPPTRMYEQRTITESSSNVVALADYVRDAARPKVGRLTAPPAVETIDHNEAQRRYNNNVPATGTVRVDPSLPTIDHRAAALKYNGALVN